MTDPADILAGYHRTGPCSDSAPNIDGAVLWCKLPHGHDGDHVSDEGTRWRLNDAAARAGAAVDRVVEAAKAWRVRIEGHVAVPLDPIAVALIAAVDALAEVDRD